MAIQIPAVVKMVASVVKQVAPMVGERILSGLWRKRQHKKVLKDTIEGLKGQGWKEETKGDRQAVLTKGRWVFKQRVRVNVDDHGDIHQRHL